MPLKQYLVFIAPCYYPGGGWSDFVIDLDSLEEAVKFAKEKCDNYSWWSVVDTETKEEVENG